MDKTKQPGLKIDHVFLLNAHFSHREDTLALAPQTAIPDLPLSLEAKAVGQPGVAAIRLRAFTPDDPTLLYRIDVEIAAIVSVVSGEENLEPLQYVKESGFYVFYPYLREAVANLTMKGRFGAIWMKPLNVVAALAESDSEPATPKGE